MEKIPRRKLLPSPITIFAFGLALVAYVVLVAFVATAPPPLPKSDFVDNDVATRLSRTLYRVHDRIVSSVCVVDVDLARALDRDALIDVAAMDPEVALEDFAGIDLEDSQPAECLEGGHGSLP